jgi:DNA invertase Pin-like site-specific DNA recombinase
MDRLAPNVEDMLQLVRETNDWGVSVEFVKNMPFTAGSDAPRSIPMFTMLSAFPQFERSLIKERQREGIALAKAKGTVYKGRKPALNAKRSAHLREQAAAGKSDKAGDRVRPWGPGRPTWLPICHAATSVICG